MADVQPLPLSVVVIAHARREFVSDALRLLERQTLAREKFEVLLVKDFAAPELEPQVARAGARVIDRAPGPIGEWCSSVQAGMRGELVAFLDDDDAFEPDKLERVLEEFTAHPEAAYLHHSTRPWDAGSREKAVAVPVPSERAPSRVVLPEEARSRFGRLWREDAAFNLSSIVVRRSVLTAYPNELRRIEVSLSAFLFYATLASGGGMLLSSGEWTRYRRAEGYAATGAPSPRTTRRLSALAGPRRRDATVLLELARSTGLTAAQRPLRAAIAQGTIVESLERPGSPRRNVARAVGTLLRDRSWRAVWAERAVLFGGMLFTVAPGAARRRWARDRGPVSPAPGGNPV